MAKKEKKKLNEVNRLWAESAQIIMQIGLTMAGCIAFGFFVGRYLDNLLGTKGIFLVGFLLFGVFGGANVVYRQIMEITDKKDKEEPPVFKDHENN